MPEGALYRVVDPTDGRATYAREDGGEMVAVDGGVDDFHTRLQAGASLPAGRRLGAVDEVDLLAPVTPSKIVCVGLNYRHHAQEMDKEVPEQPLLFMKPPSALIGPDTPIELPAQSREVHHEGELVVVIGDRLSDADEQTASEAVFGYTCGLDITARDIQRREQRYTRAKGFDTFAPVGPCVRPATSFLPGDHRLMCRVDGQLRQQSTLDDFIFGVDAVLSFISSVMTLFPGDIVFTGTPAGVGPIEPGQIVDVEIDGIGRLENPVRHRA